ncbi:MAG: glycine zipper 2TM domain-containing protein [Pseudomonadota bacterium]
MTDSAKSNPYIIVASIAVVLFSLVGIASMSGMFKDTAKPSLSEQLPASATSSAATATPAAQPAPTTSGQAVVVQRTETTTTVQPQRPHVAVCHNCGVITSIKAVEQSGQGGALGVVAGGIVGGLLGNQVGNGSGRDIATVAGAIGGGYAGKQIEGKARSTQSFVVTVRMNDGETRTVTQQTQPDLLVGDKVKVVDGSLVRS